MPQISISVSQTGQLLSYDIALDLTVATLKDFISAETGIDAAQQRLMLHGRPLDNDNSTLEGAGVQHDDMLALLPPPRQPAAPAPSRPAAAAAAPAADDTDARAAETLRQAMLRDAEELAQARRVAPQLAGAVHDAERFRAAYAEIAGQQRERERARRAELAALDGEVNAENQVRIAEHIRQQEIEKDIELAMEESPELYGRVTMLYIHVLVNNKPVKAFVDSGAQMTIMSPACAEKCGLTHKIDTRIVGVAKGVGTAKILGRIHRALVAFGDAELPCAFTVMEGKDVDMLLGLDMLKRYQACIDLQNNRLVFAGNVGVPFLPESEIPQFQADEAAAGGDAAAAASSSSSGAAGAAKTPTSAQTAAQPSNFQGPGRAVGGGGGPTPRSQPQATPAAQAVPPTASSFPEESITALERMGASRAQAIELLRACDGNAEAAAAILFDQQFS